MAKEIIIDPPGFTFQEFSLLTGLTKTDCTITNINLETRLAESLLLRIPLLSAAMTSVTGYEMALALGKEGGLGVLPARLPVDEQADIVKRIKNYEMGFVEEPVKVREHATIDEVLRMIEQKGHSKVPVVDVNNTFLGVFSYQDYLKSSVSRDEPVTKAMATIGNGVLYVERPEITVDEAKRILDQEKANYLVVLDNQKRLVKLAFKKDEERLKVGAAISTHEGWEKRVERLLAEDVDLIVVDTSDGYNEFTGDVIRAYKQMPTKVPICAGNIITDGGALYLMQAGADIIKSGMSSGSICTTKREKAVGRAPFTALMEAVAARDEHLKTSKRYVPVIADGGITGTADMIIALTVGDAVMMGGYFNRFFEASGEKFDQKRQRTTVEGEMVEVATWGEGSIRAQNLNRYGHASKHTFFAEGEEGYVPYAGRLKPNLKKDLMKIRAALSNAGCYNLDELRKNAVIERMSPYAQAIVGDTHNIKVKG
jgi:IMP dehydrogenase